MEKVIVTGGAGFIGSHIVDLLIERGYEVHIVDNLSSGKKENLNSKAVFHDIDIREYKKLLPVFKSAKYVFHEAAIPQVQYSIENPIETNDINVNGLLNVLEASRVNKIKKLIFASSSAIYGDQDRMPLVESMTANPISPYGAEKYIGEVYCKLYSEIYNLETVCLRYFNVYGKRQSYEGTYASVIAKFINLFKQGKPLTITGDGRQTRDFVHVSDVALANILAMESSIAWKGEAINIGGKESISVNDIALAIGGEIEYIDARIEPKNSQADISLARKILNWEPMINIYDGIKELKNDI